VLPHLRADAVRLAADDNRDARRDGNVRSVEADGRRREVRNPDGAALGTEGVDALPGVRERERVSERERKTEKYKKKAEILPREEMEREDREREMR